jgi:hypothetical protein
MKLKVKLKKNLIITKKFLVKIQLTSALNEFRLGLVFNNKTNYNACVNKCGKIFCLCIFIVHFVHVFWKYFERVADLISHDFKIYFMLYAKNFKNCHHVSS